ncbi:MAG: hypothetical protein HQK83_13150 [Fibrobacteria bacterium]|nr:hypothetical protein [Fibrobacteria bacterium]
MAVIQLFGLLFLLLYINGHKQIALFVLALIPVLNVGTLPAISFGLLVYFSICWIHSHFTHKKFTQMGLGIWILLSYLGHILFYSGSLIEIFNSFSSIASIEIEPTEVLVFHDFHGFLYWIKRKLMIPAVKAALFYSPFLLVPLFFIKELTTKKYRHLLSLFVIISSILGSGILFYGILTKMNPPDARQLFGTVLPLLNVLVIYLIILAWVTTKEIWNSGLATRIRIGTAFCLYLACASYQFHSNILNPSGITVFFYYNPEYIQAITKIISQYDKKILLASIYSKNTNKFLGWIERYVITNPHLSIMGYMCNINLDSSKSLNRKEPFPLFLDKQKQNGSFVSLNTSRIDFIKKFNVKIFIQHQNDNFSIPSELIENQVHDKKSNEILYVLNTN